MDPRAMEHRELVIRSASVDTQRGGMDGPRGLSRPRDLPHALENDKEETSDESDMEIARKEDASIPEKDVPEERQKCRQGFGKKRRKWFPQSLRPKTYLTCNWSTGLLAAIARVAEHPDTRRHRPEVLQEVERAFDKRVGPVQNKAYCWVEPEDYDVVLKLMENPNWLHARNALPPSPTPPKIPKNRTKVGVDEDSEAKALFPSIYRNATTQRGSAYGSPEHGVTVMMSDMVYDPDFQRKFKSPHYATDHYHNAWWALPAKAGQMPYQQLAQKLESISKIEMQINTPLAELFSMPKLKAEHILHAPAVMLKSIAGIAVEFDLDMEHLQNALWLGKIRADKVKQGGEKPKRHNLTARNFQDIRKKLREERGAAHKDTSNQQEQQKKKRKRGTEAKKETDEDAAEPEKKGATDHDREQSDAEQSSPAAVGGGPLIPRPKRAREGKNGGEEDKDEGEDAPE